MGMGRGERKDVGRRGEEKVDEHEEEGKEERR